MDWLEAFLKHLGDLTNLASQSGVAFFIIVVLLLLIGLCVLLTQRNAGVWQFAAFVVFLFVVTGVWLFRDKDSTKVVNAGCGGDVITVGGKSFLESSILLEIIASVIEDGLKGVLVVRSHNIGETSYVMNQIRDCEIQIYSEYSGTILAHHMKAKYSDIRDRRLHSSEYLNSQFEGNEKFKRLSVLGRFGFNNSYQLVTTKAVLREFGLNDDLNEISITDLAVRTKDVRPIKFKSTYEFYSRPDGMLGLKREYGILVEEEDALQHEKKYSKLNSKEMELTDGYTTDYEVSENKDFVALKDDKDFFPPYYAVPIVRKEVISNHPELLVIISKLYNRITENDISTLLRKCAEQKINMETLKISESTEAKFRTLIKEFLRRKEIIAYGDSPWLS